MAGPEDGPTPLHPYPTGEERERTLASRHAASIRRLFCNERQEPRRRPPLPGPLLQGKRGRRLGRVRWLHGRPPGAWIVLGSRILMKREFLPAAPLQSRL